MKKLLCILTLIHIYAIPAFAIDSELDPRSRYMLEFPEGEEQTEVDKEFAAFRAEGSFSKVQTIPGAKNNITVKNRTSPSRPRRRVYVSTQSRKGKYWQPPHNWKGPRGDFDRQTAIRR